MAATPYFDANDRRHMRRAIELAWRDAGATRPNPPVGAVIVKGTRTLGEGRHRAAGKAHAEAAAIAAAGDRARGATMFVTLEPCCTTGRTGPCTERIVAAGIERVVVAVKDPNPRHAGRGLRRLRACGIAVASGCEAAGGGELIAPFAKWITRGIPRVTLKLAMSLDGKIADRDGRSRWISSPASRRRVMELRRVADAILIGGETARRDRPRLLPAAPGRRPWRVVVASDGSIDPRAPVFCDSRRAETILATTAACPPRRLRAIEAGGIRVWVLPARDGHVSLRALMRRLGRLGVMQTLCEGGGEIAASLVAERLVDEFYFFIAPKILGGKAPGAVGGRGFRLYRAPAANVTACERSGPDIMLRAIPAQ